MSTPTLNLRNPLPKIVGKASARLVIARIAGEIVGEEWFLHWDTEDEQGIRNPLVIPFPPESQETERNMWVNLLNEWAGK